ncbi:MAG TPA: family 10 glycosylhydrolase [Candidatus Latescibacteria bacterium]|nr:family 10 glycosylhydrolase [Candidatus Latescibacterota bacterium]
MQERRTRVIYNCDADNMFIYDYPMTVDNVNRYVDEIVDTDITTFFMCCNYGMDMNFRGETVQLIGDRLTAEQLEALKDPAVNKPASFQRGILNFRQLIQQGHDPLGMVISRAQEKGCETFVTFRLNEVHCVDEEPDSVLLSKFWLEHPEWRVGKVGDPLPDLHKTILGPVHPIVASWLPAGLDFAVPEVRDYVLSQLTEVCERYPLDGLDLDFQRFPIYFRFGQEASNLPVMTEFVRSIRSMTNRVAGRRGRPILLSARIMETPEQNLGLGLDPVSWAREGLIDFVTISHYLRNTHPLPIGDFRRLLPSDLPIYGSIEFEREPDRYREIARQLWKDGADGIMLFNFFCTREGGAEPMFWLLNEIGRREKMLDGSNT